MRENNEFMMRSRDIDETGLRCKEETKDGL
jgi:hypothetical protein